MISDKPLNELFQVKARFCRSVSITADYGDPLALDDYILSPLSRHVLGRIGEGLKPNSLVRAWSVTGPYGAGKSAFALFLARYLGYPQDTAARAMLRSKDRDLHDELHRDIPGLAEGGFCVVPVVGSREPIALTLLRGLRTALDRIQTNREECQELSEWLQGLCNHAEQGQLIPTATLSDAVESVAQQVRSGDQNTLGLLIIVDELGKLLEYAALHPDHGDIFLLQTLAELAARSVDPPVGLVVILHQAFEQYAARLSVTQQHEWTKVQGRFEDVGFLESSGELLRLLGEAIQPRQPLDGLAEVITEESARAGALEITPRDLTRSDAESILGHCAPLHPTVSLALGRLFRSRLAQNERSLFAFLSSGEPYGFQEYLSREVWSEQNHRPFYRLDDLYDYVLAAMGSALYSLSQGKRWAEIEDALDRLPQDATPMYARLIKAIGLLGLLGDQRYLKASKDILSYALADRVAVTASEIEKAIDHLCEWGIVVYRRHKDAYSLWEGSDVDLDDHFRTGLEQIDRAASLASLLHRIGQVKPYVAKRHLHKTGTLRFFVPWIVDLEDLDEVVERPLDGADGAVIFVLSEGAVPAAQAVDKVLEVSGQLEGSRKELLLFAVPNDTSGIRDALEEVLAWEWVAANTPELEGDSTARKELAGRQSDAEARLNYVLSRCFDKASSYGSSLWVHAGRQVAFGSSKELSSALSDICDRAYHAAPVVHNELINRRTLSSAAAAARRMLIEQMLAFPAEARLGIDGFPPELSIYRSVLEASGLHHANGDRWEFAPSGFDVGQVQALWQSIDEFLRRTEAGKRCVTELFEILKAPPYGIREGLLPIYLNTALLHWEAEVALYENGSFVPEVGIAVLERLMKIPEQFYLQRYQLGQARAYLFDKYSGLLGKDFITSDQTTLLTAVRPIIAFVKQLPPYALHAHSVSPAAMAVREVILTARDPHQLLFQDLPKAVGVRPAQVNIDRAAAEAFFGKLREALLELERAYEVLLGTIQEQLLDTMRLPAELATARREAALRASLLRDRIANLRLKAFVIRLGDTQLPDREWLESVAASIANKPPKQWNDQDLLRFGTELAELSGTFGRVEDILLESRSSGETGEQARLVRLGVTTGTGEEKREIVRILPDEESEIQNVADALSDQLRAREASTRLSMAVLAELTTRVLAQSRQRKQEGSDESF